MKRSLSLVFLVLFFAFAPGCGKKGPLQPPLMRIPQSVAEFSLAQQGDKFILRWVNPDTYIDGNPLGEVSEVEVWLMIEEESEAGPGKITLEEFEKKARLAARLIKDQFPPLQEKGKETRRLFFVFRPEQEADNQKVYTFSLRVRDERRRTSAFSELLSLELQVLPLPPRNVQAEVHEEHILLTWDAPLQNIDGSAPALVDGYSLYRSVEKGSPVRLNSSPVQGNEFRDADFAFGQTYRYFIRAVASSEVAHLESDDSETVEVEARDAFPPAPPSGLTAIAGAGFVALSWQPNAEADLAGYRVWRKDAGQEEFRPAASVRPEENAYLDSAVEKNKGYDYAITALDKAGNESRMSAFASAVTRQESR
ncbi:MAG: hypothetical protein FJY81_02440 [Candidatus Aminicenantes bacterium]|nr:hypothetical protein [Candidatus Aminicenantes bacterium]